MNMALSKDIDDINEVIRIFEDCTEQRTLFLSLQPHLENNLKSALKSLYDQAKKLETYPSKENHTIPKLIINEFDLEQIWQQIEIQNQFVSEKLEKHLLAFDIDSQTDYHSGAATKNDEIFNSDDNDDSGNSDDENTESDTESNSRDLTDDLENAESGIEDDDVDLSGSNDLDDHEILENSEDSIDYFQELQSDDENSLNMNDKPTSGLMYKDFFKNPEEIKQMNFDEDPLLMKNKKSVRFDLNESKLTPEKNENYKEEVKSTFEQRQDRLRKRVEKLEEEALAEKPWQLKGEVTAKTRPPNSLLEEVLEFDVTARPAPIITEEAALKLEDIIIQRIKDRAWDDVERKIKPVDTPLEFKKKLVLDQEKSKLSLAKIYEQEYLKQKEAADPQSKLKEEEPKEYIQIRKLLDSLFRKLDSLSNYHYTPLPAAPELQIVNNLPSVTLEEAVPAAVSDATLLAPEEIKNKRKGDLMSKDERTATDKKRSRRQKKLKQSLKQKEIQKRELYSLQTKSKKSNTYGCDKMEKELEKLTKNFSVSHGKISTDKVAKSSKKFFEHLQDTVKTGNKVKRKNDENVKFNAKRIKL